MDAEQQQEEENMLCSHLRDFVCLPLFLVCQEKKREDPFKGNCFLVLIPRKDPSSLPFSFLPCCSLLGPFLSSSPVVFDSPSHSSLNSSPYFISQSHRLSLSLSSVGFGICLSLLLFIHSSLSSSLSFSLHTLLTRESRKEGLTHCSKFCLNF